MAKNQKKEGGVNLFQRNGRSYPESVKRKVVSEIQTGSLSQRAAEKKFKINRKTIDSWITQYSLIPLKPKTLSQTTAMAKPIENNQVRFLSKQVSELQKALEKAQLKIDGLETMIRVSEEELKIKIRKKPGAKRSKE